MRALLELPKSTGKLLRYIVQSRIELLIGNIHEKAVVKMENYHRLHATLSRLKIPVLDSIR